MIQSLWFWLMGYVIVKFKGASIECLLNLLIDDGISVWSVERVTTDVIVAQVSVKDFRRLRPLLWKLNIRVSIVGKKGLPFFWQKFRRRQFLIVGLVIFLLILYYLSGFIWFIQLEGNEEVSKEDIFAILKQQGLQAGASKKDFSPKAMETALLTQIDQLSWAGISFKGSLVKVQVVERSTPDQATIESGDLVASQDGLVTHVLTFRGTPNVQPGTTVRKGDILIKGNYYDMYGRAQVGKAEGVVKARVWYEAVGEAAFRRIKQQRTGKTHVVSTLTIGERKLTYNQEVPYAKYIVEREEFSQTMRGYTLPVRFTRSTYHEVFYETRVVPESEAKEMAISRAWAALAAFDISKDMARATQVEEIAITDQYGIRVGLLVEVEVDIAAFLPKP